MFLVERSMLENAYILPTPLFLCQIEFPVWGGGYLPKCSLPTDIQGLLLKFTLCASVFWLVARRGRLRLTDDPCKGRISESKRQYWLGRTVCGPRASILFIVMLLVCIEERIIASTTGERELCRQPLGIFCLSFPLSLTRLVVLCKTL